MENDLARIRELIRCFESLEKNGCCVLPHSICYGADEQCLCVKHNFFKGANCHSIFFNLYRNNIGFTNKIIIKKSEGEPGHIIERSPEAHDYDDPCRVISAIMLLPLYSVLRKLDGL